MPSLEKLVFSMVTIRLYSVEGACSVVRVFLQRVLQPRSWRAALCRPSVFNICYQQERAYTYDRGITRGDGAVGDACGVDINCLPCVSGTIRVSHIRNRYSD